MSDTTTQTARLTSLTGLLIPLSDRHLLLPNVAVAELIDYQDSVADPAAPQWYLGPINWRNRSLPLLSFEAACGSRARVGGRARIVVLNALGGRPDLKFIALLTQGMSTCRWPSWNWPRCKWARPWLKSPILWRWKSGWWRRGWFR
jgi:chemosensory pili system protein ChpC